MAFAQRVGSMLSSSYVTESILASILCLGRATTRTSARAFRHSLDTAWRPALVLRVLAYQGLNERIVLDQVVRKEGLCLSTKSPRSLTTL